MRDCMDELVEALIADGEMQDRKAYLEEGGAYASMTVEGVNQKWVAAFTAVAFGDDARLGGASPTPRPSTSRQSRKISGACKRWERDAVRHN